MNARTTLASAAITALLLTTATACGSLGTTSGGSTSTSGGSLGGANGSTGGTGTTGGNGGAAGDNQCYGKFNPLPSGIIPGASVKATLMTVCTTPPQSHVLQMYLQRDLTGNGAWTDQATKTIDRIPAAMPFPNLITAPCVPGRWRLVISIDGVSATGLSWHVDQTGATVDITPHECG